MNNIYSRKFLGSFINMFTWTIPAEQRIDEIVTSFSSHSHAKFM